MAVIGVDNAATISALHCMSAYVLMSNSVQIVFLCISLGLHPFALAIKGC